MKLIVALALALAPLRTDADGPPAKGGLRVFEGAPGDKKSVHRFGLPGSLDHH